MTASNQQVFISYQRTDEAFARQVRERLAKAGVRAWMDQYDIPDAWQLYRVDLDSV